MGSMHAGKWMRLSISDRTSVLARTLKTLLAAAQGNPFTCARGRQAKTFQRGTNRSPEPIGMAKGTLDGPDEAVLPDLVDDLQVALGVRLGHLHHAVHDDVHPATLRAPVQQVLPARDLPKLPVVPSRERERD